MYNTVSSIYTTGSRVPTMCKCKTPLLVAKCQREICLGNPTGLLQRLFCFCFPFVFSSKKAWWSSAVLPDEDKRLSKFSPIRKSHLEGCISFRFIRACSLTFSLTGRMSKRFCIFETLDSFIQPPLSLSLSFSVSKNWLNILVSRNFKFGFENVSTSSSFVFVRW